MLPRHFKKKNAGGMNVIFIPHDCGRDICCFIDDGRAASAQQSDTPLKIGVMTDFGSVYSDIGGAGNVEGAKMAIEEFGGTMFGKPIELVTADPQMKADIAANIARNGTRPKMST